MSVTIETAIRARTPRADGVDGDDQESTVEAVGEDAGDQAEQEWREPLDQRGERDQQGIVRL